MIKLLAFWLLLLGTVAMATNTIDIQNNREESVSQELAFVPSVSSTPELSFTLCDNVYAKTACHVSVSAIGFGSKYIVLSKRLNTGKLVHLKKLPLDVAGRASFDLMFEESGIQNLLIWVVRPDGLPAALDGMVLNVAPAKGALGTQSDISSSVNSSSNYYYWNSSSSSSSED